MKTRLKTWGSALLLAFGLSHAQAQNPQPAVIGNFGGGNTGVVFSDGTMLPNPPQMAITGMPADIAAHGVDYFGRDSALISDFGRSRVHVVKVSTATRTATIDTSTAGYTGTGTIAVAPNLSVALACGTSELYVIKAPFNASSAISSVTLPGAIAAYQTEAIVFNSAGRAFVYNTEGISVLDPPYSSVAFTIPFANTGSGAVAISPDGETLLATDLTSDLVEIFHAPFSVTSVPDVLTVPGASRLDGIRITPDGSKAVVVDSGITAAFAISAPFSPTSNVQELPMPAGAAGSFEDVGISADGQVAILAGNSGSEPPIFIRAPFTAAGAQSFLVPINGSPGRGTGSVRFLPPGLAPGLTISKSAPASVLFGFPLKYTIRYANTGTVDATNVVIRDPLPTGTTFVSATDGGKVVNGKVVFNIGNLPADSGTKTVSFTVDVGVAAGSTIINHDYTIQARNVSPIAGPPVETAVRTPQLVNLSTRGQVMDGDEVLIGGFVLAGDGMKHLIVRGMGPSLGGDDPVPGRLANPQLRLMKGNTELATNDNWTEHRADVEATGIPPTKNAEAAIVTDLTAGAYTVILSGANASQGIGLIELYDLNPESASRFVNISTRGMVQTGNRVMIAGFIVAAHPTAPPAQGNAIETVPTSRYMVRGLGPSLKMTNASMGDLLQDPAVDLYNANGVVVRSDDDWKTGGQQAEIEHTGLAPKSDKEAALIALLRTGRYTAILRGADNGTGIGLVEIYQLNSDQ